MRKIHIFFVMVLLTVSLIACGENTNENVLVTDESSNTIETEIEVDPEEELEVAKKDEDVIELINDFSWKEIDLYGYPNADMDFLLFVDKMRDMDENLFAKEFVEQVNSLNFENLNEKQQFAISVYFKLLFREGYESVVSEEAPVFTEAWYGNEPGYTYVYIRLSDYPSVENLRKYVYISRRDVAGTMIQDIYKVKSQEGIKSIPDLVITDTQGSKDDTSYQLEDIGVDELNSFLEIHKDFVTYLIEYRDNYYAPVRNGQIALENEGQKKQNEIEEALSKKIPQIGMTSEEVKMTSWGMPDKINKDTYEWGVKEQWVYDGKGYVYLENGVVTSVSER